MTSIFKSRDKTIALVAQFFLIAVIAIAFNFNTYTGIALLLFYIAGWCDGLQDTAASSSHYFDSIFAGLNPHAYLICYSWKWKYADGRLYLGEAFFGSLFLFTAFTDYWHFIKTSKSLLIAAGIAFTGQSWIWSIAFPIAYFTGKQLMWNLLLPLKEGTKPNILQLITRIIMIYPFFFIWRTVASNTNAQMMNRTGANALFCKHDEDLPF